MIGPSGAGKSTLLHSLAGQISLCQGAFAATGAFTVYQLDSHHTMPLLLAMLVGLVGIVGIVGLSWWAWVIPRSRIYVADLEGL